MFLYVDLNQMKKNTYRHVPQQTAINIITIIRFRTQSPKREDSPISEVLVILRKYYFVNCPSRHAYTVFKSC